MADTVKDRRTKKKGPDKRPERGPAGGETGPAGVNVAENANKLKTPGVIAGAKRLFGGRPAFRNMGTRTLNQIKNGVIEANRRTRSDAEKEIMRRKREGED